ncbi:MAG TPA: hypothetical protein VMU39_06885 [Solirubrobacteraceae bacterium]|nr:hypothetical protein [Solirubrobacteraceae bacterium]
MDGKGWIRALRASRRRLRYPFTAIARPYGLLVVALEQISAMAWCADSGILPLFGLPRTL